VRVANKARAALSFFSLALAMVGATLLNEEFSQSFALGCGSWNLHGGFRGRQAELCEDGQELPHERQQGVQLR
jgi:hypothetical protein